MFIQFIRILILLIPMPFLFHYIETSLFKNGGIFAFTGTFLFIILAGLISVKSKLKFVFLISTLSILLSMVLGGEFIISSNESWFNPFGMNFTIVFAGIIILIGVLIVRSSASELLKNS
jgi:hypothetical protein